MVTITQSNKGTTDNSDFIIRDPEALKEHIRVILETLVDREQTVLRLHYGLNDGKKRSLEAIGKKYGLTGERIRQIESKAFQKIRHPSRSRRLWELWGAKVDPSDVFKYLAEQHIIIKKEEEVDIDDISDEDIYERLDPDELERKARNHKSIRIKETPANQIPLKDFSDDTKYEDKTLADLLDELNTVSDAKQIISDLQKEAVFILKKNASLRKQCLRFENDAAQNRKENQSLQNTIIKLLEEADLAEEKHDKESRNKDSTIKDLKQENATLQQEIGRWKRKVTRVEKEKKTLEEKLRLSSCISRETDMEIHLNSIIEFMDGTARQYGIMLNNIHVVVITRDNKYNVNVRGEIGFTDGATILKRSVCVKASLYSVNGYIEQEGKSSVLKDSFAGYDTFDIGWTGGSKESWLALTKIRLFVVAI